MHRQSGSFKVKAPRLRLSRPGQMRRTCTPGNRFRRVGAGRRRISGPSKVPAGGLTGVGCPASNILAGPRCLIEECNRKLSTWDRSRPGHRQQVPAHLPIIHTVRTRIRVDRGLQHVRPRTRRSRTHGHPSLELGLQGGRLHLKHRRSGQYRHRQGLPRLSAQWTQGRRLLRGLLRRLMGQ